MRRVAFALMVSGFAVCCATAGIAAPDAAAARASEVHSAASTPGLRLAQSKKSRLQLCLALRGCRSRYTRCFNRIEKKPEKHWSAEREKCVAAYKICIDKHFKHGEMLFTRWFVPDENCEQYR